MAGDWSSYQVDPPEGSHVYSLAAGLVLVVAMAVPTMGADKTPTGPELAPKEIAPAQSLSTGVATEPPGDTRCRGSHVGCDYLVGKAKMTITVTTHPGDPMPCKRTVAFE